MTSGLIWEVSAGLTDDGVIFGILGNFGSLSHLGDWLFHHTKKNEHRDM